MSMLKLLKCGKCFIWWKEFHKPKASVICAVNLFRQSNFFQSSILFKQFTNIIGSSFKCQVLNQELIWFSTLVSDNAQFILIFAFLQQLVLFRFKFRISYALCFLREAEFESMVIHHEVLKLLDSSLGGLCCLHFHKAVAFWLLVIFISYNLDTEHLAL